MKRVVLAVGYIHGQQWSSPWDMKKKTARYYSVGLGDSWTDWSVGKNFSGVPGNQKVRLVAEIICAPRGEDRP